MRTTRSEVTFERPFVLNMDVGELPAGTYQIDTDEEEILVSDRTAYRRTALYFYVSNGPSTRMLVIDPHDLDSALGRDSQGDAAAAG
jgi:hypothetical protein